MSRTLRRKTGLKPRWIKNANPTRGRYCRPLEGKQLERYKKILYTDGGFPFQYVPSKWFRHWIDERHRMTTKTELAKFKKNETTKFCYSQNLNSLGIKMNFIKRFENIIALSRDLRRTLSPAERST